MSQHQIDVHLSEAIGQLEVRLSYVEVRLNRMEKVLSVLVDRLVQEGVIAPVDPLVEAAVPGAVESPSWEDEVSVRCPGCGAVAKGVTGKPGERCGWCGQAF